MVTGTPCFIYSHTSSVAFNMHMPLKVLAESQILVQCRVSCGDLSFIVTLMTPPFGSEITSFHDLFFMSKNIGHFMTCRMLTDKNFIIHLLLWCRQGWCLLVAYFAWLAYLSPVILMTTTIGSNFLLYVYGWAQNIMENSSDASCFLGYIWEVHESSWCWLLKDLLFDFQESL